MKKIATVTDDGKTISPHFGRATKYAVLTIEDDRIIARELRDKAGHHDFQHEEGRSLGFLVYSVYSVEEVFPERVWPECRDRNVLRVPNVEPLERYFLQQALPVHILHDRLKRMHLAVR